MEMINLKKLFYWIGDLRESQQSIEEQVKKVSGLDPQAAGPSKLHVRQLHKLITLGDRWVPQKSKSKHVSLSVLRKSNSIDIIKASAVIKAPFAVVLDVLQNYDPKFWSKRNHAELADCRVVEQTGHHQSMWYQQYAVPFPFSNYDQIHIHHRFVSQETQKALICIYSTAGTEFELPPNFIRWFVKGSGWLVDGSKSPTECEVVSIIQHETDPSVTHIDRIPDWLVKWAEIAIVRDLGKLKDYVEGEQAESAKAIKEMERKQAREQKEVSRKTSNKTRK